MSLKRQRHIRKILTASVGKSLGSELYSTLTKWESSCGREWTVKRLKALNSAAKQIRGGNLSIAKEIFRSEGISFRTDGTPRGVFGEVISRIRLAQRPAVLRRLFAILRVYSCMLLDSVSDAQLSKTRDAIGKHSSYDFAITKGKTLPLLWKESDLKKAMKYLNLPTDLRLAKPNLSRLKGLSSYHRKVRGGSNEPWGKAVRSLLTSCYIPQSLKENNPCEDVREALVSAGADSSTPGHIALLQEGGAKARVVAVPNVWCQWLFEPLHQALNSLIKRLPASAVHDQNRGAFFLSAHIGKPVWCFDLSSATDRYPRSLQMQVLEHLGLSQYSIALEEISTAEWEFLDERITYAVGQPMGLYGSFPLFHLSHYLMLEIACMRCGVAPSAPRPFMVLGDDVVITNANVAAYYRQLCRLMEVELSETKSIVSDSVSEFGGFLCLQTNRGSTVFRPYKFGEGGLKNPLTLLHSLGGNSKHLGPYWAKIYSIFARTSESRMPDLSPIVRKETDTRKRVTLDSYYLGSLVTRVSYQLPFVFPDISSNVWSRASQDFLGNEEVTTTGSYAAPLRVQLGHSLALPEKEDEEYLNFSSRINTDPLIRALRYADV